LIYFCAQKNRRARVLQSSLNGIDYLEVSKGADGCAKELLITMLHDARQLRLTLSQIQLSGGGADAQVQAISVTPGTNEAPNVVTVALNQPGDFSTYTLSLVADPSTTDPPAGFDQPLSTVCFSFKAGCPTTADCLPCNCCPPDLTPPPDINYMAKDFGGFRQVMLDRMSVLAPAWTETHPSDIGIALVETLAYVADRLSYQQDSVGTEAYIGTARSRISLRRHAKLVDYHVTEGSNARTWVQITPTGDRVKIPAGTLVFPLISGLPSVVAPNTPQAATLLASPIIFATMEDATLWVNQTEMNLYTWGDDDCCLPAGATSATLLGNSLHLRPGAVLVFKEVIGPQTGDLADANPDHRWAVRLTGVRDKDYLGNPLADVLLNNPITEISWGTEDALPFPLCISSQVGTQLLSAVSLAYGNIVPADHGAWQDQVLPGNVTVSTGSTTVAGTGTLFTNTLQVGQWIVFEFDPSKTPYEIQAISNNTSLTLSTPYVRVGSAPATGPIGIIEDLGVVSPPPPAPITQSSCACPSLGSSTTPRPRYYPELENSPVTFAYSSAPLWSGTVTVSNGSPTVTAVGSSFGSLAVGQWLVFASDPKQIPYQIDEIESAFTLTLTASYSASTQVSTTASQIDTSPAAAFMDPDSFGSQPPVAQISVYDEDGTQWNVLNDLLSSSPLAPVCVLEIEYTGSAFLRFGDGQYGMAPEPGMDFQVRYRVGNGTAGNIGRDSISHILTTSTRVSGVGNPLPAVGGVDPESMNQIRQEAPYAFLTQLRAVTEDDYGNMAELDPAIAEAKGTLRWTGSWYTAFVSVDSTDPIGPSPALLESTETRLNLLRMMGVDLAVEDAVIVGLRIEMDICVDPAYFQGDIKAELLQLFTTGTQCTGQSGILNPENFSFGETVYTSPFIAAAQGVQGVTSVRMALFQRMDDPSIDGAAQGFLTMGRLEIPRCDNDPNRLDHGILVLRMDGGK